MEFILNGKAHGSLASRLVENNFDLAMMRPFVENGQGYITQNIDGEDVAVPVQNADATLLVREWIELDKVVVKAALPRLRAVADLRGRGLEFNVPNGMGKTVLQTQSQSDINEAQISMDGLAEGKGDRPEYDLTSLPLPIISKDFSFSSRQIATSRNGSMPLDFSMAELAARKVAEAAEEMLLGTGPSYTYGGGSIYGYTNFPGRITKVLQDPTHSSWKPKDTLRDVLNMKALSQQHFHYGPWVLYVAQRWDEYLDNDYSDDANNASNITLRERILKVENVEAIVTLDFLVGYDMVLVQMSSDVARQVVGAEITTVQWQEKGGMRMHFKVLCILVPQIRADHNGNTGIVHGTVSGQTTAPSGVTIVKAGSN